MTRKRLIPFYFLISASSAYQVLCTTAHDAPFLFARGLRWICLQQRQVNLWLNTSASLRFGQRLVLETAQPSKSFGQNSPTEEQACLLASECSLSSLLDWALPTSSPCLCLPKLTGSVTSAEFWGSEASGAVGCVSLDSVLICFDYPLMKGPNVSACSWRALLWESEGTSLAGSFCPDFHPTATWDTRNLAAHTH